MVDRVAGDSEGLYIGNGSVWHHMPFKKIVRSEKFTYTLDEYAGDGRVGFAMNENKFTISFTDILISGTNTSTASADKLLANLRSNIKSWMVAGTLQIKVYYSLISDYIDLRDVGEDTLHVFCKDIQDELPNGNVNEVFIRKITFELSKTPT